MPFGSDVVPEECMTIATSSARAARALVRRVLGDQLVERARGRQRDELRRRAARPARTWRSPVAAEPDDRAGAGLPARAPTSWATLNIGGSGASTTPRCRQPSTATAASIEWRPSSTTTSPGCTPAGGEARGERDGGAAQFRVRHGAVVEHERDLVRAPLRARGEVLPQVPGRQWPSA